MNFSLRGEAGPEVTALVLPETLRREIHTEIRRAHPRECCGLLIGRVEGARAVVTTSSPGPNLAPDPETGFEIDTTLLFETRHRLRGTGQAVLGHYHSHPQGPATPSPTDRDRAWTPGHVWLIAAPGRNQEGLAFSAHLAVEAQGRITLRPLEIIRE